MRADGEVALHVNFGLLEEEPEQLAFFRGAFLAGGSVTDPAKRYHLELATPHLKVSAEASVLLREIGFSAKETSRAGNSILYFKQSDTIEDFLTAIGAQVSAMGVMEAKQSCGFCAESRNIPFFFRKTADSPSGANAV